MATQAQIGAVLGVSQPMVARMVKRGMPCADTAAAADWYGRNVRSKRAIAAPSGPADKALAGLTWVERLAAAKARMAELELARQRGLLLPADEVVRAWEQRLAAFKARILAIPSKLGAHFGDVEGFEEALTTALHQALTELSGASE